VTGLGRGAQGLLLLGLAALVLCGPFSVASPYGNWPTAGRSFVTFAFKNGSAAQVPGM
jgi:hypothetical protein